MLRQLAFFLTAFCALPLQAETLTVFAAASTKTALDQIAPQWTAETGHHLSLSYAGSSALARQIQFGAPADLFLSANTAWMDVLDNDALLVPGSRRPLLGNRLVLIAHDQHPPLDITTLPDALGQDYLAMALVDAVPAGIYGKSALIRLGLWDSLSGQIAQTDNVRAALTLVAAGEAPFGITYATDVSTSESVSVVYEFSVETHGPITYPVAAISDGNSDLAAQFLAYLNSPDATATFTQLGFKALSE